MTADDPINQLCFRRTCTSVNLAGFRQIAGTRALLEGVWLDERRNTTQITPTKIHNTKLFHGVVSPNTS